MAILSYDELHEHFGEFAPGCNFSRPLDPYEDVAFVMPKYRRTKVANVGQVRLLISDWKVGLPPFEGCYLKVRMCNHFCYKCGSRFFCMRGRDSAYEEGLCMICGWMGVTEEVKFMVPIPLPDQEPEVMACFPGAGMSGGPLGAMHSGSLKGASSP